MGTATRLPEVVRRSGASLFFYRPKLVGCSWTREELLTWELYRALHILPRAFLLEPFMRVCSTAGSDAATALAPLLRASSEVRIDPFPRLRLSGNKRNSASDLGLLLGDDHRVWIEVKTAIVKPTTLRQQLRVQSDCLRDLSGQAPSAVVALVPGEQDTDGEASVRWPNVVAMLEATLRTLADHPAADLVPGLALVADELIGRIVGHYPKLL